MGKTLKNFIKKIKFGLVGFGLIGMINSCSSSMVAPEFDYNKIPREYRILPDQFTCNYWDDKNNDKVPQFEEVSGLKNVFYSNEPITIIKKIENKSGKSIRIVGYQENILSKFKVNNGGVFLYNDKILPDSDSYYSITYIPPGKLESGKTYDIKFIHALGAVLFDVPIGEIKFKLR